MPMDLRLKDRNFVVAAASRGLGFGVAKALTAEDANVLICGRTESTLEDAVTKLGNRSDYVVADVSEKEEVKKVLDVATSKFQKLDGLFVNAGGPPPGEFSDISDEQWQSSFDLTLMSAVWLTRFSLPLLEKSDSPSILYSTSISVKQPIDNLLLSNSIRSAVIGLMRTLSDEIGSKGVRVNAVCPGYIYTQRVEELLEADEESSKSGIESNIPIGRIGTPEEYGRICTFLLSPVAGYIHGASLLVDGGLYRGML